MARRSGFGPEIEQAQLVAFSAAAEPRMARGAALWEVGRRPVVWPWRLAWRSWLASPLLFYVLTAAAMVGLRLACFDGYYLFGLRAIPNHDMSQGASFFATNLHSVRLTGDFVWWQPAAGSGYAQYFQSFLSPLAPTSHHITFLLLAEAVLLLSKVGLVFSDYRLYLVENYLVLPFLTFVCLSWLCGQFFRRRVVCFVLVLYTLSGIGVWNSAWFYFQEPFSLFFSLAALFAFLRQPSSRHLGLLVVAALVWLTSFNYWTLYHAAFVLILVSAYALQYWARVRGGLRSAARLVAARPRFWGAAAALAVVSLLLWGALIGSATREQASRYDRASVGTEAFSMEAAFNRVPEFRRMTLELFNPSLARATEQYSIINPAHNARYIGVVTLALLILFPFMPWRRRERWLFQATVGIFVICLAPGFLLSVWDTVPFMNRIQHFFYFYQQHWQFLLVLLAACVFDRLTDQPMRAFGRRSGAAVVGGLGLAVVATLTWLGLTTEHYKPDDLNLQAITLSAMLLLLSCAMLFQMIRQPTRTNRALLTAVLLLLVLGDMGRYFWQVSRADMGFTRAYVSTSLPMDQAQPKLNAPLAAASPIGDFSAALTAGLPLQNYFWPVNQYLTANPPAEPPLVDLGWVTGASAQWFANADARLKAAPQPKELAQATVTPLQWRSWSYNDFTFGVTAPNDGNLFVRVLYDPLWRITVDGAPATPRPEGTAGMLLPLTPGAHEIRLTYQPLGRRLFWPAVAVLQVTLLVVLVGSTLVPWRRATTQPGRTARPNFAA